MKIVQEVKKLLIDANSTQVELAAKMGTTQANISKKLISNTLYSKDIEKIANVLGYDLKIEFIKKND